MQWKPKLAGSGFLHERIIQALERDVRAGIIKNGTKLPAQRLLADHLGLSVGTVTKAYLEAERRGLVRGHVGRGTFVTSVFDAHDGSESFEDQLIDLSVNIIPHNAAVPYFIDTKTNALRHREAFAALEYPPPAGAESQRRNAIVWLKKIAKFAPDWRQLILTAGAQHAMALVFEYLLKPGDTVLCEGATFFGMKALANFKGYKLCGLKMDEEGIHPADLEKMCVETKARVLYLMPTAQNPTGRTMGKARRQAIAKIARKHKLWIVEADIYAIFCDREDEERIPIAALLPDRTFYIGGVSKSLAPGLRLGFLVCPSGPSFDAVIQTIRTSMYAPSALGSLLFSQWVDDGSAFKIANSVREEIARRIVIAREILGSSMDNSTSAPHLWLPLSKTDAERVSERALRAGLVVTPPDSLIVQNSDVSGIRVCLGPAASVSQLTCGLQRLKQALDLKSDGWQSMV